VEESMAPGNLVSLNIILIKSEFEGTKIIENRKRYLSFHVLRDFSPVKTRHRAENHI